MSSEPAVRDYVVGPGEGVPDRTPEIYQNPMAAELSRTFNHRVDIK